MLKNTVVPEEAPEAGEYVTINFEKGIPVAVNGKKMDALKLLTELNKIGGRNGVGLVDICENRCVGMKSRGVYETPGGAILYFAHRMMDHICLDRDTYHYKQQLSNKMAELIYDGKWFTTLMDSCMAFVDKTQETVTGDVTLKLYKGNIIPVSVTSPYSLYSSGMATFDEDDCYDQSDSAGFINLYGLPLKVRALKAREVEDFPGVE
jgi:argininosuccinate synthase